jgi:hypothetical protein
LENNDKEESSKRIKLTLGGDGEKLLSAIEEYLKLQSQNFLQERKSTAQVYKSAMLKEVTSIKRSADALMALAEDAKIDSALPTASEIDSKFPWAAKKVAREIHKHKPEASKEFDTYVDRLLEEVPPIVKWANGDHQVLGGLEGEETDIEAE